MSCSWCVREVPGRRMEPSSWQVHFRNLISTPARLALRPRFGDHRVGPVPPVFYFLLVEGGASSPVQAERSSAGAGGCEGPVRFVSGHRFSDSEGLRTKDLSC